MSNRDKDAEILALRHQITVLERHLHGEKIRFTPADRALLAALLHRLPRDALRSVRLLVRPETVLRWHRDLIAYRHAVLSRPQRAGRPPTIRSIRLLVLRVARENSTWGYRRVHGELLVLGVKVAASTVWEILKDAGIDPAPQRTSDTWATFLRCQAHAILAAEFSSGPCRVSRPGLRSPLEERVSPGLMRIRALREGGNGGGERLPARQQSTKNVDQPAVDGHDVAEGDVQQGHDAPSSPLSRQPSHAASGTTSSRASVSVPIRVHSGARAP
jgi:transposase